MTKKNSLTICFMGGRQAGIIGALTILSKGHKIAAAVSYSDMLTKILDSLKVPVYKSVDDKPFVKALRKADALFSVHGREIVKPDLLGLPKLGAVNIHPYLYIYKGADPVDRALRDRNFKASVGAHMMNAEVDKGKVLTEEFTDVTGARCADEVYNRLYPYYCVVISKALEIICKKHEKHEK